MANILLFVGRALSRHPVLRQALAPTASSRRFFGATPLDKGAMPSVKTVHCMGAGISNLSMLHALTKAKPLPGSDETKSDATKYVVYDLFSKAGGKARTHGIGDTNCVSRPGDESEHALRIFGYSYKLLPELMKDIILADGTSAADHWCLWIHIRCMTLNLVN